MLREQREQAAATTQSGQQLKRKSRRKGVSNNPRSAARSTGGWLDTRPDLTHTFTQQRNLPSTRQAMPFHPYPQSHIEAGKCPRTSKRHSNNRSSEGPSLTGSCGQVPACMMTRASVCTNITSAGLQSTRLQWLEACNTRWSRNCKHSDSSPAR
jgi:hypothetical protein